MRYLSNKILVILASIFAFIFMTSTSFAALVGCGNQKVLEYNINGPQIFIRNPDRNTGGFSKIRYNIYYGQPGTNQLMKFYGRTYDLLGQQSIRHNVPTRGMVFKRIDCTSWY